MVAATVSVVSKNIIRASIRIYVGVQCTVPHWVCVRGIVNFGIGIVQEAAFWGLGSWMGT